MGREFDALFDEWSHTYDNFVLGYDEQYREVFANYNEILEKVSERAFGQVLEFGVGTGNLTEKLFEKGLSVIGIEPSKEMRKVAQKKLGRNFKIHDGDFLHFQVNEKVNCIVSSYAFHHLTDREKEVAIEKYAKVLPSGSKVIFADTMFENTIYYKELVEEMKKKGYKDLVHDLETEYYPLLSTIISIFEKHDFSVFLKQMNRYVWIVEGIKR